MSNTSNTTPRIFVDGQELAVETVPVAELRSGDLVAPAGSVNDEQIRLHTLRRVLRRDGSKLLYGTTAGNTFSRLFSPETRFHRVTGPGADQLAPLVSAWDFPPELVAPPEEEPLSRIHLEQILDAWTVEGPVPGYHRDQQAALRRHWPNLAQALDAASRTLRP